MSEQGILNSITLHGFGDCGFPNEVTKDRVVALIGISAYDADITRAERLIECLCSLDAMTLSNLLHAYDHKGSLCATWRDVPSIEEISKLDKAWEEIGHEESSQNEHYVANLVYKDEKYLTLSKKNHKWASTGMLDDSDSISLGNPTQGAVCRNVPLSYLRTKNKKSNYGELLKHPNWQKKRLEVMQFANFKCQLCGESEKMLNVHHSKYEKGKKPWEYPTNALICLCEDCHTKHHKN